MKSETWSLTILLYSSVFFQMIVFSCDPDILGHFVYAENQGNDDWYGKLVWWEIKPTQMLLQQPQAHKDPRRKKKKAYTYNSV
jgi:hypothetical protein